MDKFIFNSIIRISDIITVLFLLAISFGDEIEYFYVHPVRSMLLLSIGSIIIVIGFIFRLLKETDYYGK